MSPRSNSPYEENHAAGPPTPRPLLTWEPDCSPLLYWWQALSLWHLLWWWGGDRSSSCCGKHSACTPSITTTVPQKWWRVLKGGSEGETWGCAVSGTMVKCQLSSIPLVRLHRSLPLSPNATESSIHRPAGQPRSHTLVRTKTLEEPPAGIPKWN